MTVKLALVLALGLVILIGSALCIGYLLGVRDAENAPPPRNDAVVMAPMNGNLSRNLRHRS